MPAPDEVAVAHRGRNRSYTRRGGRMPQRHHRALAQHGDRYILPWSGSQLRAVGPIQLGEVFGRQAPVVVEIGSGSGDCIVEAARRDPDVDFVAVEVWRPGIAQTIAKAVHHEVTNLRVVDADAGQELTRLFEPGSLDQVWVFFPDPWPKTKHHKRRLVTPPFADGVAQVLRPGGRWRLATDWSDYAWQLRDVVEACPAFDNPYTGRLAAPGDAAVDPAGERGGFAPRFAGRPLTRFETKGLRAGRVVRDLEAIRVAGLSDRLSTRQ